MEIKRCKRVIFIFAEMSKQLYMLWRSTLCQGLK